MEKLQIQGIKTKSRKTITHKDLRYAISIMIKKHPTCRWRSEKFESKKYYILIEGYYWLIYVYFQKDKSLIDADIDFFLNRIKQYEEILASPRKELFTKDMYMFELPQYFNREYRTIEKAVVKMIKTNKEKLRFIENGKYKISKLGIEILCKYYFKQKYLEILENYKMELTEKYIKEGYPYDNFFNMN